MTKKDEESVGTPSQSQIDQLRTLFVEITGTEAVVIDQVEGVPSRDIGEDGESISAYVAAVAKNDGLADAIEAPDDDR